MRRLLAMCLSIAMVWALARPAMTHVHVSSGADRVIHDHGPLAHEGDHHHHPHEHARSATQRSHAREAIASARHVGGRDSSHTVFFKVATTMATAFFTMPFDVVEKTALTPAARPGDVVLLIEPRQHGPPQATPVPARAPPSFPTA